ncbi:allophanate hydrolase [Halieaceae bacterium IMCC14734]|uniref:Allophanate hydrolase n=1 Tax=Candidatus Litorirhabdus singularis TaxID=2518993 RepID=A0ABT3TED3_9GAMM|nr:allophanate hydrolase [Candidatus Litorirhabdus singularis]MCX2980667.1 allophanate hydrolase [Candidatus Litorirhabdus singularis]
MSNIIHNLSLSALQNAYAEGSTTPRQLLLQLRQQALAESEFNAWIHLLSEKELEPYLGALETGSASELPLYGVPFAIKDNIDLAGVPTTAACPDFAYIPEQSAALVEVLINAGAIPLGKTNLDQFATGLVGTRSPYGEGKNSFVPEYISGGSSAGSAIATSLGQVSFALGTDTAGSGRVPAVLNNLVGLKPSKGLLSTRGVVPACRTLDCVSIFALNSDDAASIFDVAARYDELDPYARENAYANRSRNYGPKGIKQGFTFAVPDELDFQDDPETERLFHESVAHFEAAGGVASSIDFAPFLAVAKLLYEGPWVAERWLATQAVASESMLPVIQTIIKGADGTTAADAFSAQYLLARLKKQCDALIAEYEFVVMPTMPTFFTRAQMAENPIVHNSTLGTYTNFVNLLDYTATAVPVGFTDCGVPWGVTLLGQAFEDIHILNYCQLLQHACKLPMATGPHPLPTVQIDSGGLAADCVDVAVCGAHLEGQPLNWQLTERGSRLLQKTASSAHYKLYALADGKRPAMVRDETQGASIEVEVWSMPVENFGSFVAAIPAPLGIGKVELADGRWVCGFICDAYGVNGARDITEFASWREWLARA